MALKYKNEIRQRCFKVCHTIEKDGVYERVVGKVLIGLTINAAKPFICIDNDSFNNTVVKEYDTPLKQKLDNVGYKIFICDEEYELRHNEERFVYMGEFTEPLTKNMCLIAYDKRFKDIIIIPGLNPLINDDGFFNRDMELNIVGAAVGYYFCQANDFFINENVEPAEHNFTPLPLAKEGVVSKSYMLQLPASDPDTAFKDTDIIEPVGTEGRYVIRGETRPRQFIKLGKMSDFLVNGVDSLLPVYFTYNYSPTLVKIAYGGIVNTKDRDIYIEYGS